VIANRELPMLNSEKRSDSSFSFDDADTGARQFMLGVYCYMAGGLAMTGAVAYAAAASGLYAAISGTPLFWVILLAPLAVVLLLSSAVGRMSTPVAQLVFWVYAGLNGLSLSGIFIVYTGSSIAGAFFAAAATFAVMSVVGYVTRIDLSRAGPLLLMGLVGIVIADLVNFFLKSSAMQYAVSLVAVLLFVGLTAFDTQRIKTMYRDRAALGLTKNAIMGALSLYLDFVNLLLLFLQFTGNRRRR
jgi:FtsH-binding integral membrane protein